MRLRSLLVLAGHPGRVAASVLMSALSTLPAAFAAAPQPTVTFVEGDITMLSGGRAFLPSAGVRLRSCDALRTGPTAMVQVEFDDGSAILLGPDTRFVFDLPHHGGSGGLGGPAEGAQFLHSGWAKITAPRRANATAHFVQTPSFDLSIDDGVAVLRVAAAVAQVYVERGAAAALDTTAQQPARIAVITVRSGFTYSRKPDQPAGTLSSGAEPGLARALPRTLRDTLPMRLAKLKDRDVRPRPAAGQAEADEWLASAPELRACSGGDGIRKAQEILARKGFDVGPIDGVLGSRTSAALRSFQQQVGLPTSGQLDPETRRAVDEAGSR